MKPFPLFLFMVTAAPLLAFAAPTLGTNLIVEGGAEQPPVRTATWITTQGSLYRSSSAVAGKVGSYYFYGGPNRTTVAHQWVDLSAFAAWTDAGHGSLSLRAWLGGETTKLDSAGITLSLFDATRTKRLAHAHNVVPPPTVSERGSATKLMLRAGGLCDVPSKVRWAKVEMTFFRVRADQGIAMIDEVTMRYEPKDGPFPFGANIVLNGRGTLPITCGWTVTAGTAKLRLPSAADYSWMFVASATGLAVQTRDVSSHAALIDGGKVRLLASAMLGGYLDNEDNTIIRVTLLNAASQSIGVALTDKVTVAERDTLTKHLPRHTGFCTLPSGTRTVKIEAVGTRTHGSNLDGYWSEVDVRLLRVDSAPTQLGTNLVVNGDVEYGPGCAWTVTSGTLNGNINKIKNEYVFYGTDPSTGMAPTSSYQWVDISAFAADLDRGRLTLHMTARMGGWLASPDYSRVTAAFHATKTGASLWTKSMDSPPSADRGDMTGVIPMFKNFCGAAVGARWLKVTMLHAFGENGGVADGYVGALDLQFNYHRAHAMDSNIVVNGNALEAEPTCGWSVTVGALKVQTSLGAKVFYGLGTTTAYQWADVSFASSEIDAGDAALHLSARLGGYLTHGDNAKVTVRFYKEDRTTALGSTTTVGPYLQTTRGTATKHLDHFSEMCTVPALARWAKVTMSIVLLEGTNADGYVRLLDARILRGKSATSYGQNLVVNPDTRLGFCGWTTTEGTQFIHRTALPEPVFCGLQTTAVHQWIDLSFAAADIDANNIAVKHYARYRASPVGDWVHSTLQFYTAGKAAAVGDDHLVEVKPNHMPGSVSGLWSRHYISCIEPPVGARWAKLSMKHYLVDGGVADGYVRDIAVELRRYSDRPTHALDTNLLVNGDLAYGACAWDESQGSMMSWEFEHLPFAVLTGLGQTVSHDWVDLSFDAAGIDARARAMSLSADIGGGFSMPDSAHMEVTFFTAANVSLGHSQTLTEVTAFDRGLVSKMIPRYAYVCQVPPTARYARVTGTYILRSGSWADGYLKDINAKLEPKVGQHFQQNLVVNGDAKLGTCGWTTTAGTLTPSSWHDLKKEYFLGQGATTISHQWIDVSFAAAAIASGTVEMTVSALLGGSATETDTPTFTLQWYEADRSTEIWGYQKIVWGPVTPAQRSDTTQFLSFTKKRCMPHNAGWIKITMESTLNNGVLAEGFFTDMSVVLTELTAPASVGVNLILDPSNDIGMCQWVWVLGTPGIRDVIDATTPVDWRDVMVGMSSVDSVAVHWTDVSFDAASIDAGLRALYFHMYTGGFRAQGDYQTTTLQFYAADKTTGLGTPVTVPGINAAQRSDLTSRHRRQAWVCQIPTGARWLRVHTLFKRTDGTVADGYLDDMVAKIYDRVAPVSPSVGSNVVSNGKAGNGWCGWTVTAGILSVREAYVGGKDIFFSDANTGFDAHQWVDVSFDAAAIDGNTRQVVLAGNLGGHSSDTDLGRVHLEAYDATKAHMLSRITIGPVTKTDRASVTMLLARSMKLCALPVGTRHLKVIIDGEYVNGIVTDSYMTDIAVTVTTSPTPQPQGLGLNIARSEDTSKTVCFWTNIVSSLAVTPLPMGGFYFINSPTALVEQWMYVGFEAAGIDARERILRLKADIGGPVGDLDTGHLLIEFFASRTSSAIGETVRLNHWASRAGATTLKEFSTTSCWIPEGARFARIRYSCTKHATEGSNCDFYVNYLDVSVRLRPLQPQAIGTNLLIHTDAVGDPRSMCPWNVTVGTMVASTWPIPTFYATASLKAMAHQIIDVTFDAAAIDAGTRTVNLTASLSGYMTQEDAGRITAEFFSTRPVGGHDFPTPGSLGNGFALGPVAAVERDSILKMVRRTQYACSVPVGTRYVLLQWRCLRHEGSNCDGYFNFPSLVLEDNARTAAPIVSAVRSNLVRNGDGTDGVCGWTRDTGLFHVMSHGSVDKAFVGSGCEDTTAHQWVDLSFDSTAVDAEKRSLVVDAGLGGVANDDGSSTVIVEVYTAAKASKIATAPPLLVPKLMRSSGTKTVLDTAVVCELPVGSRWAKVTMRATCANTVTALGLVDDIAVFIDDRVPAPTEAVGLNLVANPDAEHGICGWTSTVSTLAVTKQFMPTVVFAGESGTSVVAHQWVDLSFDQDAISWSLRALRVAADLGGCCSEGDMVELHVTQYKADKTTAASGATVLGPVTAADRGSVTKLNSLEDTVCFDTAARWVKAELRFTWANGYLIDGYAKRIHVSVVDRPWNPPTLTAGANLVFNGDASVGTCGWSVTNGELAVYSSAVSSKTPFYSPSAVNTKAHQWVNLSLATPAFAAGTHTLRLQVHLGGYSTEEDTGQVHVSFFETPTDAPLPASTFTVGPVTKVMRGSTTKLVSQVDRLCPVPATAQFARVTMECRRAGGAACEGFMANIVATLVTVAAPPTQALDTNLVRNGDATEDMCFWTKTGGLYSTTSAWVAGHWVFYAPDSVYAGAHQWIDVAFASALIDEVKAVLKITAQLGGYLVQTDHAIVTARYFTADRETEVGWNHTVPPASAADRGGATTVVPKQNDHTVCTAVIPPGARAVKLSIECFRDLTDGSQCDGYVTDLEIKIHALATTPLGSVGVSSGDALALPLGTSVTRAFGNNLVLNGNADYGVCGWTNAEGALAARTESLFGVDQGLFWGDAPGASVAGVTTAYQWIDVSFDAANIDAGTRTVRTKAHYGTINSPDTATVVVEAFSQIVSPSAAAALPAGGYPEGLPVLDLPKTSHGERHWVVTYKHETLHKDTRGCNALPPGTRWLKVTYQCTASVLSAAACHGYMTNISVALDDVNPRSPTMTSFDGLIAAAPSNDYGHSMSQQWAPLPALSAATSPGFDESLVYNPSAADDFGVCGWESTTGRVQPYTSYVAGTSAAAPSFFAWNVASSIAHQWINITSFAAEIAAQEATSELEAWFNHGTDLPDEGQLTAEYYAAGADGKPGLLVAAHTTILGNLPAQVTSTAWAPFFAAQCGPLDTTVRFVRLTYECTKNSGVQCNGHMKNVQLKMRRFETPTATPALDENLVRNHDTSLGTCFWDSTNGTLRVKPADFSPNVGTRGFYSWDASTTAEQWVDLSAFAADIDTGSRFGRLQGRIGASGDDIGYVHVEYHATKVAPALTSPTLQVGPATRVARRNADRFLRFGATGCAAIPATARWARVVLECRRSTGWMCNGEIASLTFNVTTPLLGPSTPLSLGDNLLFNPDGRYDTCGWETVAGDFAFAHLVDFLHIDSFNLVAHEPRGFMSPNVGSAEAVQWVDLSVFAADIDAGTRQVNLTADLIGVGFETDAPEVSFEYYTTKAGTPHGNGKSTGPLTHLMRESATKVVPLFVLGCQAVPTGVRWAKVKYTCTGTVGKPCVGIMVRASLSLVEYSRPEMQLGQNLFWNADVSHGVCDWVAPSPFRLLAFQWDNARRTFDSTTDVAAGAHSQPFVLLSTIAPSMQATYTTSVAWATHPIDRLAAVATLGASLGGIAASADAMSLTLTLHKKFGLGVDPTPAMPPLTFTSPSPAERGSKTGLFAFEATTKKIPAGVRYARLTLTCTTASATVCRGFVSNVTLQLSEVSLTVSLPYGTQSPTRSDTHTRTLSPSRTLPVTTTTTPSLSMHMSLSQTAAQSTTQSVISTATATVLRSQTMSSGATASLSATGSATPSVAPSVTPTTLVTASGTGIATTTASTPLTWSTTRSSSMTAVRTTSATRAVTLSPSTTVTPTAAPTISSTIGKTATPSVTASTTNIATGTTTHVLTSSPTRTASVSTLRTLTSSHAVTSSRTAVPTTSSTVTQTAAATASSTGMPSVSSSRSTTASTELPRTASVTASATYAQSASVSVSSFATASVSSPRSDTPTTTATATMPRTATPSNVMTGSVSAAATETRSTSATGSQTMRPSASPSVSSSLSTVLSATVSTIASSTNTGTATSTVSGSPSKSQSLPPSRTVSSLGSATTTQSLSNTAVPSVSLTAQQTSTGSSTRSASASSARTRSASHMVTPSTSQRATTTLSITATSTIDRTPSQSGLVTATLSTLPTVTQSLDTTASATTSATQSMASTRTSSPVPSVTRSGAITRSTSLPVTVTRTMVRTLSLSLQPPATATTAALPSPTVHLTSTRTFIASATPTVAVSLTVSPRRTVTVTPNPTLSTTLALTATGTGTTTQHPTRTVSSTLGATTSSSAALSGTSSVITTRTVSAPMSRTSNVSETARLAPTVSWTGSNTAAGTRTAEPSATKTTTATPRRSASRTQASSDTRSLSYPPSSSTTATAALTLTAGHTLTAANRSQTVSAEPSGTASPSRSANVRPTMDNGWLIVEATTDAATTAQYGRYAFRVRLWSNTSNTTAAMASVMRVVVDAAASPVATLQTFDVVPMTVSGVGRRLASWLPGRSDTVFSCRNATAGTPSRCAEPEVSDGPSASQVEKPRALVSQAATAATNTSDGQRWVLWHDSAVFALATPSWFLGAVDVVVSANASVGHGSTSVSSVAAVQTLRIAPLSATAAPGATIPATAAPPSVAPSPPTPPPRDLNIVLRGTFAFTASCGGSITEVSIAPVVMAVLVAALLARIVATAILRKHTTSRPSSTGQRSLPSGKMTEGSSGCGYHRALDARDPARAGLVQSAYGPQQYVTREVTSLRSALPYYHLWVAWAVPEHHFAGPSHAATVCAHGAALLLSSALVCKTYGTVAEESPVALVLVGVAAAVPTLALRPLLASWFYMGKLRRVGLGRAVPLIADRAQDLLTFGARRKLFVGVSQSTVQALDVMDFDTVAHPRRHSSVFSRARRDGEISVRERSGGGSSQDDVDAVPGTRSGETSDSAGDGSSGLGTSAGYGTSGLATSSLAVLDRRTAAGFHERQFARVDRRWFAAAGYAVCGAVAVAAFVGAAYITAPWCGSRASTYRLSFLVALVSDVALLQPTAVGLALLYHWMTSDERLPGLDEPRVAAYRGNGNGGGSAQHGSSVSSFSHSRKQCPPAHPMAPLSSKPDDDNAANTPGDEELSGEAASESPQAAVFGGTFDGFSTNDEEEEVFEEAQLSPRVRGQMTMIESDDSAEPAVPVAPENDAAVEEQSPPSQHDDESDPGAVVAGESTVSPSHNPSQTQAFARNDGRPLVAFLHFGLTLTQIDGQLVDLASESPVQRAPTWKP